MHIRLGSGRPGLGALHTYMSRLPILFNIRTGQMEVIAVTEEYMSGFV